MAFYLVERYIPSMTAAELRAATARLAALPAGSPPAGAVRHLWTILVAAEDICLSVFEALDIAAVEDANVRAGFRVDRVVEVVAVDVVPVEAEDRGPDRGS